MPFPFAVGGVEIADAGALAVLVREELTEARVVPGSRPADWVAALVASGDLERRLAIGLAAALLQHPDPSTVAEGARLADRLGEPILGPVLVRALTGLDALVLLQVDPGAPGRSVEDSLLDVIPRLSDLRDPEVRGALLAHLRNAGLPDLEASVLARAGEADELRLWLPALTAEALSPEALAHLARRAASADPGGRVVAAWLADRAPAVADR